MLEAVALRARRVPARIRTIVLGPPLLLSIALTIYFMVTDSGPWMWISNAQAMATGGEYYPKLSFLCTWLGFLLTLVGPAGVLVQLIAFAFPPTNSQR
jgi:hypothetical protein